MRRFLAIILALTWLGAAEAAAQGQAVDTLVIERGQVVTVQFDEGGGALLVAADAALPMTAFELSVARDFVRGAYDHAIGDTTAPITSDKRPPPDAVQPHMVRLKFVQVPDSEHTMLLIDNGYDRGLVYSAVMHIDGEGQHTDVCLVMPNLRGLEHWPYRIDRIALSNFRLQPWRDGDPLPCA